jgi:predicted AlkP superfamily pyrophosphatase or phosphodiesterase
MSPFIKPQYGSRCFSDIPQTVLSMLTGAVPPAWSLDLFHDLPQQYDRVVVLYLDAFGWRFVDQFFDKIPLLQRFDREGVVAKISSQFPSTTAAHVTAIHTGQTPGQSGVFEWQYYEPLLDKMISPLLFSFAGDKIRDTLNQTGIDPARLYPDRTIYQDLKDHGVRSTILQAREFTPSTYSRVVFKGANVIPYVSLPEALVRLRQRLIEKETPAYYFLYFDKLDTICHHHGPQSPHAAAETEAMLTVLDQHLFRPLDGKLQKTLFLITADHGQVEVDPKTTVYINLDKRFEGYEQFLKQNLDGQWLVPAGSARDMFLYIHEDSLEKAFAFFSDRLEGIADVHRVQDLIDQGFFGPLPVSEVFLARVGNLVILPYAGQSVWWYEKGRFDQKFYGHHGGLTPAEAEIPLLLYAM